MGVSVTGSGDRCIITEYVDGGSVFDLIRSDKEISPKQVHQILEGAAIGMSYLHSFEPPLLHRDLKSPNLLLNAASGEVKVADFGLSRSFDNIMTFSGTPQWTAPEITRHEKYGTKADGLC